MLLRKLDPNFKRVGPTEGESQFYILLNDSELSFDYAGKPVGRIFAVGINDGSRPKIMSIETHYPSTDDPRFIKDCDTIYAADARDSNRRIILMGRIYIRGDTLHNVFEVRDWKDAEALPEGPTLFSVEGARDEQQPEPPF